MQDQLIEELNGGYHITIFNAAENEKREDERRRADTLLWQYAPQMVEEQHLVDLIDLSKSYPYCAPLHQLVLLTLHRMGDLRFSSDGNRRSLYIS